MIFKHCDDCNSTITRITRWFENGIPLRFSPLLDAHDVAGIPCDTSLDKFDSRHTGKTETKKEQILNLLAWASLIFFVSEKVTYSKKLNLTDICSQKRDSGICPGNVPRFYFDKTLGQCQLFSYGGCGGNSNNFEALDQCVAHCGGPREDVFQVSRLTGIHY